MIKTGLLTLDSGVSSLDGTPLARAGAPNPFTAATNFLAARGLGRNKIIQVDGSDGFVGNVQVIFITAAGLPAAPKDVLPTVGDDAARAVRGGVEAASGGRRSGARAATKSGGKRGSAKKAAAGKKATATKGGAKKATAKKGGAKKGGAKKGGAKRSGGGRTTAKRSAKKSASKQSGKGARKR